MLRLLHHVLVRARRPLGNACVRLREQDGIALIMALGILMVATIGLTTVIALAAGGARHAGRANAGQNGYALAEAGLNNAVAVLHQAYGTGSVDFYSPPSGVGTVDPSVLLPPRTSAYDGGTVTWSGTYCMATGSAAEVAAGCNPATDYGLWRLQAIATVSNPTGPGAGPVKRTVKAKIQAVLPSGTPPSSDLWNWIYAGKGPTPRNAAAPSSACDTVLGNSVHVSSPLYVAGNLCVTNNSSSVDQPTKDGARVGQKNRLVVGGFVRNDANGNIVGANSALGRLTEAHISGECSYKRNDSGANWLYLPCGDSENVYVDAGELFSTPPATSVTAPLIVPDEAASCPPAGAGDCIDLNTWYTLSHPGPRNACATVSGTPPTFDNNAPIRDKSLPIVQNLTPSFSYTCRTVGGEISWNNTTKVLTVRNPIFIDGSAYFDTANAVATYSGRGTIFVSGTFVIKNATVCALKKSDGSGCDFDGWDPNVAANGSALAIAAFGNSSNGGLEASQVTGGGIGIQIKSANYQGLLYAKADVDIVTTARAQGPIVTPATVRFGQTGAGTFPPLSILPTGAPGTPVPPAQLGPPEDFAGG